RPPPRDGRFESSTFRPEHLGDASRLVPAAALKAVGVCPCAFDSRRLRLASVAQRKSNRLLSGGSGCRNSPGHNDLRYVPDAQLGLLNPAGWVQLPGAAPSPAGATDSAARSYRAGSRFESGAGDMHLPLAPDGRAPDS